MDLFATGAKAEFKFQNKKPVFVTVPLNQIKMKAKRTYEKVKSRLSLYQPGSATRASAPSFPLSAPVISSNGLISS